MEDRVSDADGRYYKHFAPLEREGATPTVATNIPLRWSGTRPIQRALAGFLSFRRDGKWLEL